MLNLPFGDTNSRWVPQPTDFKNTKMVKLNQFDYIRPPIQCGSS